MCFVVTLETLDNTTPLAPGSETLLQARPKLAAETATRPTWGPRNRAGFRGGGLGQFLAASFRRALTWPCSERLARGPILFAGGGLEMNESASATWDTGNDQ